MKLVRTTVFHVYSLIPFLTCTVYGNDLIADCFIKIAKNQLKDADVKAKLNNATVKTCMAACVNSTARCRSLNYYEADSRCLLYKLTKDIPPAVLKHDQSVDYYEAKSDCDYQSLILFHSKSALKKRNSWSDWSLWSECDADCGPGVQSRSRYCMLVDITIGAAGCGNTSDILAQEETNPCECSFPSRVQPELPWLEWSSCSSPCGTGFRHRRGLGGKHEVEKCFAGEPCEANEGITSRRRLQQGSWAPWSQWTVCECSAGERNGVRSRFRNCRQARIQCVGESLQNENCNCGDGPTPGPGSSQWQQWGPWSQCSVTCSIGDQTRTRSCPNAYGCPFSPANTIQAGFDGFSETERKACNTGYQCRGQPVQPTNGWSIWAPWSQCSVTCGDGGVMMRLRLCGKGVGGCGTGTNMEQRTCNEANRGQLLNWGNWHEWSSCTRTCGGGERVRRRKCPCYSYCGPGVDTEVATCGTDSCQTYGNWESWTPCSVTCGEGITTRNRPCLASSCPPDGSLEKLSCTLQQCQGPVVSQWTPWQPWSQCSATCGNGQRQRIRSCSSFNGCGLGPASQSENCFVRSCTAGPGWAAWAEWGLCTTTCGTGQRSRRRVCQLGEGRCQGGSFFETEQCVQPRCDGVIPSQWSPWTQWSQCSVTCGGGQRTRSRTCPFACGPGQNFESEACQLQICGPVGPTQCQQWTQWSQCSVTCGIGSSQRVRNCPGNYTSLQQPETFQTKQCLTQNCIGPTQPPIIPSDCSPWIPWSPCSVSCGTGQRTRTRECPQVYGNVNQPNFPTTQSEACTLNPCSQIGSYTQWSPWTACSTTCGQGQQSRSRFCSSGVNNCGPGLSIENKPCLVQPCQNIGTYTQWTPWTACSRSCGQGQQTRSRLCSNGVNNCGPGLTTENKQCFVQPCQTIGSYTEWTPWTACSQTCGQGQQTRSRLCSRGFNNCGPGSTNENQQCFLGNCQTVSSFGPWSPWTTCSTSCGQGQQSRSRNCLTGTNTCGLGPTTEDRVCFGNPCTNGGSYTQWSPWSQCSSTCGPGQQTRNRFCPSGQNNCFGPSTETTSCQLQQCFTTNPPLPNGCSQWNQWSQCSVTCGTGERQRTRDCPQSYSGAEQNGFEQQPCTLTNCVGQGAWTEWAPWTTCSSTCGPGQRTRLRICSSGQNNCVGQSTEIENCQQRQCTASYLNWSQWSTCSSTCGAGQQTRSRVCPTGPNTCGPESAFERKDCFVQSCQSIGNYNQWTQWTRCSATCGNGQQSRSRICSAGSGNCGIGPERENRNCFGQACPSPVSQWNQWGSWASCSVTCGSGEKIRVRNCPNQLTGCGSGSNVDTRSCFDKACTISWSAWSGWNQCSVTCGQGLRQRTRICPGGAGRCGSGDAFLTEACFKNSCVTSLSQWSQWSPWSSCSTTCGPGQRERNRNCPQGSPRCGQGLSIERDSCFLQPCVSNWAQWTVWTPCSVTCGQGQRQRSRFCPAGQSLCRPGSSSENESCFERACQTSTPIPWSQWSQWSSCSVSCGQGQRERNRLCPNGPNNCGFGSTSETDVCIRQNCVTTGGWTQWTSWSSCSATCGGGTRQRNRICSEGQGQCFGGQSFESDSCSNFACQFDVNWTQWSQWSSCSQTCGSGSRNRQRSCPRTGECFGDPFEQETCNRDTCPLLCNCQWSQWSSCSQTCRGQRSRSRSCQTGGGVSYQGETESECRTETDTEQCGSLCQQRQAWSRWLEWSQCSVPCGNGQRTRTRSCLGGSTCPAANTDIEPCFLKPCDSGVIEWTSWGIWSFCSITCGDGVRERSRSCPLEGRCGNAAEKENDICIQPTCGGILGWTSWTSWSQCSVTCGTGTVARIRLCSSGNGCGNGPSEETRECLQSSCTGSNWSQWNSWVCSITCGQGTEIRTRSCPFGGCQGVDDEKRTCEREACTESGWGVWGPWSRCSSSCGSGSQQRTRPCVTRYLSCIGSHLDVRQCDNVSQCSGPFWLQWNDWSGCSLTCGGGTRTRIRICTITGQCDGNFSDTEFCNGQVCGLTGQWNQWAPWTQCTATCGRAGRKIRERRCPIFNGCDGYNVESQSEICNAISCTNKNKVS